MKLLIVDDSSIMRRAIQKYLDENQIEVVGMAGNGLEAIEVFKKTDPDLVTMDITMPEMDGLTCLQELLKIKPATKVMVITALTDNATGLRALKLGAKNFLGKPFTPEKLNDAFQKLIEGPKR